MYIAAIRSERVSHYALGCTPPRDQGVPRIAAYPSSSRSFHRGVVCHIGRENIIRQGGCEGPQKYRYDAFLRSAGRVWLKERSFCWSIPVCFPAVHPNYVIYESCFKASAPSTHAEKIQEESIKLI